MAAAVAASAAGSEPSLPSITVVDKTRVVDALVALLSSWAGGVSGDGALHIAVAGGSLLTTLAQALQACSDRGIALHLPRWRVWYIDERHVPHASPDSNHGGLVTALRSHAPAIALATEPVDTSLSAAAAADEYGARIAAAVPAAAAGVAASVPAFHLILAGMGEDGHIASLFPGHALLGETARITAHLDDSPKPPPTRITVTMPVIAAAGSLIIVATGAGKADALVAILGDSTGAGAGAASTCALPVALAVWARLASGHGTAFVLDDAAASKLPAGHGSLRG